MDTQCGIACSQLSKTYRPRLHREIVGISKDCQQCQVAGGRKIKPFLRRNQKVSSPRNAWKTIRKSHYFLVHSDRKQSEKVPNVSIDHFNGWPEAKFLREPDTESLFRKNSNF